MYRYRDAGYYASAYGFGENRDCPAYVSGAALFILFVAHNILNLAWWAGIGKGLYSRTRWMRTILNVLLLIDFLLVMLSGILYAVGLHRITALLFLILTVIHIRVHWKRASAKQQK